MIEFDYAKPFALQSNKNTQSQIMNVPPVQSLTGLGYYLKDGQVEKVVFHGLSFNPKRAKEIIYLEKQMIVSNSPFYRQ